MDLLLPEDTYGGLLTDAFISLPDTGARCVRRSGALAAAPCACGGCKLGL
jgi:hypothetical protein